MSFRAATIDKLGDIGEEHDFIHEFFLAAEDVPVGGELGTDLLDPFYAKLSTVAAISKDAADVLDMVYEDLTAEPDALTFDDLENGDTILERKQLNRDASWIVFFGGRRTGICCSAASRSEAISKARKKKRRGGDNVVSARQMTSSETKTARSGKWVKSRPPGFTAGMRGKGPKPKASK